MKRFVVAIGQGLHQARSLGQQGFRRAWVAVPNREAGGVDLHGGDKCWVLRLPGQVEAVLIGGAGGVGVALLGEQIAEVVEAGGGDLWGVGLPGQGHAAVQVAAGVVGGAGQPQTLAQRAQHGGAAGRVVEGLGQRLRGAQGGEGVAGLAQRLLGLGQLQQGVDLPGHVARLSGSGTGGLPVPRGLVELPPPHSVCARSHGLFGGG